MKAIARNNVYWPNIDQQIEEYVRLCPQCRTNTKYPTKTSLCSLPISTKPPQRVHIDIAGPIPAELFNCRKLRTEIDMINKFLSNPTRTTT